MPDSDNPLGGRLPLLDADALGGDQQKLDELIDSTLIRWAEASGFQAKTASGVFIGPFNPLLDATEITPEPARKDASRLRPHEPEQTRSRGRGPQHRRLSNQPVSRAARTGFDSFARVDPTGIEPVTSCVQEACEVDPLTGDRRNPQ